MRWSHLPEVCTRVVYDAWTLAQMDVHVCPWSGRQHWAHLCGLLFLPWELVVWDQEPEGKAWAQQVFLVGM